VRKCETVRVVNTKRNEIWFDFATMMISKPIVSLMQYVLTHTCK
jgi:hypothetical protein